MSRESIIRELPKDFVLQMLSWARTSSCVGHYAISQAYTGMPGIPHFGPRIPAGGGESSHIERALDAVPNRERLAVRLFWLFPDADLVWLGQRLHVHYETIERRVRKGHELLRADLARRQAAFEYAQEHRAIA